MSYQPRWINGETIGTSLRDAAGRYAAIAKHLEGRYGFTVLDLGAHAGYFSLRLAAEFGATVTAVDNAQELVEAMKSPHPGVTPVFRRFGPGDLEELRAYDVILCLSVLHHVTWWRRMLEALVRKADVLFVEVANPAEVLPGAIAHSKEIPSAVELFGGRSIHRSPGFDGRFLRDLYVIKT